MRLSVIILTLACLAFFSTIVGGGLYYYSLKEVALEESGSNAVSQAQLIKNRVSAFIQNNLNMVWLLAQHQEFGRFLRTPDRSTRRNANLLLDKAAALSSGSVCYLLDVNGTTVASSNRADAASFVGKNYGFRPYFKTAFQGRLAVYFALGVTSGKRGIYTGVPVFSKDAGRVIGVVVIKAPIDDLEKELVADTVGTWTLADRHGVVFASNRGEWLFKCLWPLSDDGVSELKQSKQFGNGPWDWIGLRRIDEAAVMDQGGRRYLASKVNLDVAEGWRVTYFVDPEALFETIHHPLFANGKYIVLLLSMMICTLTVVLYCHARIDIARRKSMETALRKSEALFRIIFHTSPDPLGINRFADGTFVDVNEGLCRVSGYDRHEIIGHTTESLGLWENNDDLRQLASAIKQDGRVENLEVVLRCRSGKRRHYLLSACGIDLNGEFCILSTTKDIEELKRVQKRLQASETYLSTLMATIQTGVVVIDAEMNKVVDANPFAAAMLRGRVKDLIGRDWGDLVPVDLPDMLGYKKDRLPSEGRICTLQTLDGQNVHVRHTSTAITLKERAYRIESFLEITDIVDLMRIQQFNIDLAKHILHLINGPKGRSIESRAGCRLFVDAICVPCHAEGGDHFFVRNLVDPNVDPHKPARTVISLKDQSGHEVSCVLRSIFTDLVHHSLLGRNGSEPPGETVAALNRTLIQSDLFRPDDFFTAVHAVIDHRTLEMRYVFAGHPPFLLIRNDTVHTLPEPGAPGTNPPMTVAENIPYFHGTVQLEPGDRLICYTDGLTEMPLKNSGRVISLQRLQMTTQAIVRQRPDIRVMDLMHALLHRIAEDAGEQVIPQKRNTSADDVTLLGLEVESADIDGEMVLQPHSRAIADQIGSLYATLADQWRQNGFEAAAERLRIVLEEAVLNAWHHGNRQRPDSSITVRWWLGNQFKLEVLDEGEGFDYRRIPDPIEYANRTAASGRGIYMMRYCTDGLDWKDGGRRLVAVFNKRKTEKRNPMPRPPTAIDLWHPLPETVAG